MQKGLPRFFLVFVASIRRAALAAALTLPLTATGVARADFVFTTFDPPGSTGSIGTQVAALNNSGAVAGSFRDTTQSLSHKG
jgi:hypothetical protein